MARASYPRNLIAHRFGRLTVVQRDGFDRSGKPMWRCRCACGGTARANRFTLVSGHTQSCGCYRRERLRAASLKHGGAVGNRRSPELEAYSKMHTRCDDPRDKRYADWGGRGIRVCARWSGPDGFKHFLADMGPRPSTGYSIDRVDNDGPYEPANCRWATAIEQRRNNSYNWRMTLDGVTRTISEWCELYAMPRDTVRYRIKRGWSSRRALMQPIRRDSRHGA